MIRMWPSRRRSTAQNLILIVLLGERTADRSRQRPLATSETHFTLLNSTTSLLALPRETANHLPSREKSKHDMRSAPKFVSCTGLPPPIGKLQRFEMPPRVST